MKDSGKQYELVGETVRIFRREGKWYANYQWDGRQHRKSLQTRSKKEARRKAIEIEADLLRGDHQSAAKAPSIESLVSDYLAYLRTEGRSKKTLAKYENVLDRVLDLARRMHRRNVLGINLAFVDKYRQERSDAGRAPKTIYTETNIIRQLVNFALSRKFQFCTFARSSCERGEVGEEAEMIVARCRVGRHRR
ncbi:MAG: hypothetical protein DWQ35_01380 [Planctomycetota bacterium]|nr:MAG: hypothetical protein DWQ29_02170 [Planctomycetota bacterium]REJ97679.1 MAG: hypothetical protein DWQ35_01380 [Planctomycetota bacterium]